MRGGGILPAGRITVENDKAVRLTAPKVQNYIDSLNSYGLEPHACTPETLAMLPELFAEVMKISPYYANGVRLLHFCVDRGPIEDFGNYEDMLAEEIVTNREDFERLWKEYFPDEKCWFTVGFFENDGYRAIRMNHKLIVSHRDDSQPSHLGIDARELIAWLTGEVKNCQRELRNGTYNDRVARELPPGHRLGTITRKAVWELWPEEKADFFKNISEADVQDFMKLMQSTDEEKTPSGHLSEMTSGLFFRCCELGYRANKYDKLDGRSPKEVYLAHADGRDEGLRDIPEDSAEAFRKWFFDRERGGGHPWEVCRGGNSTHVSLYVAHSEAGFYFSVDGPSWGRSIEAINFYLAIRRAGYPVVIREGKRLAARLTGTDRIGIVPDGVLPVYCEGYFNDDDILDYMNLPDEDRDAWAKRCVWFPEPELRLL